MGILANQAFRLRREEEWTANELSEELWSIFRSKEPVQIDSPVQLTNNTSDPALSIANNGNGTDTGDVFNITSSQPGPITFENAFPGVSPPPSTGGGSGGGGVPCKVVSGTGASYVVTLYPNGINPSGNVAVTQLQIDSSETIPPGSWGFAVLANGRYFIQFPVWQ